MSDIVTTFFGIIGAAETVPATLAELIPYLLHVFIGLVLVIAVFKVIASFGKVLLESARRV